MVYQLGPDVTIQLFQLGHWGLPLERQDERVEKILFAAGRKVGADDGKGISASFGVETTGDFLLEFGHSEIAFGLVVVEGNAQAGEEAQDLVAGSRSRRMRLQAGDCLTRPRVPGRRGRGGLPASALLRMVS